MSISQHIYGVHAVAAFLQVHPTKVKKIYVEDGKNTKALAQIANMADENNIQLNYLSKSTFNDSFSQLAISHQGVVADIELPTVYSESYLDDLLQRLPHDPLLLVLDCITDPHNLGACLRSAVGAGVDAVIIPKDKSVGLTPAVHKVASGAVNFVPTIQVVNVARILRHLKLQGIWVAGMALESSDSIYSADLTSPLALVMGSEGKGLRQLTRQCCDYLLHIPMYGQIESLNVSVATGISLFEIRRQRSVQTIK